MCLLVLPLVLCYLPSEDLSNVVELLYNSRCDEKRVVLLDGVQIFP